MFVSGHMTTVDVVEVAVHRRVRVPSGGGRVRHFFRARDVIRAKLTLDHGPTLKEKKTSKININWCYYTNIQIQSGLLDIDASKLRSEATLLFVYKCVYIFRAFLPFLYIINQFILHSNTNVFDHLNRFSKSLLGSN